MTARLLSETRKGRVSHLLMADKVYCSLPMWSNGWSMQSSLEDKTVSSYNRNIGAYYWHIIF